MKLDFTKAEFQAWLESKAPSAQVGLTADRNSCPLANFITKTSKTKDKDKDTCKVYVYRESIEVWDKKESHVLKFVKNKAWMTKFIKEIDGPEDDNYNDNKRVSAKRALEALSKC